MVAARKPGNQARAVYHAQILPHAGLSHSGPENSSRPRRGRMAGWRRAGGIRRKLREDESVMLVTQILPRESAIYVQLLLYTFTHLQSICIKCR